MAIPYILTIQESLFGTFEDMLSASGVQVPRKSPMTSPVSVVKKHWTTIQQTLDEPSWLVFELLIELRHDITHRAGVVGQNLVDKANALTPDAKSLWERMAGKPISTFALGAKHQLDHADMVVCLAVVKFLAKEGNEIMQGCYPRTRWLSDFVEDVSTVQTLVGNLTQKARKTRAFARTNYGPLNFALSEIEQEISSQEK